jgi:hypothetical protein
MITLEDRTAAVLLLTVAIALVFCLGEWLHRRWALKRLTMKSAWLEQHKPGAFRATERSKETDDDIAA